MTPSLPHRPQTQPVILEEVLICGATGCEASRIPPRLLSPVPCAEPICFFSRCREERQLSFQVSACPGDRKSHAARPSRAAVLLLPSTVPVTTEEGRAVFTLRGALHHLITTPKTAAYFPPPPFTTESQRNHSTDSQANTPSGVLIAAQLLQATLGGNLPTRALPLGVGAAGNP